MPLYGYKAIDKAGMLVTSKLEAEHEISAAQRLRTMGYIILDVVEIKETNWSGLFRIRSRVGLMDLDFFSRQLAAMLAAGIPLSRCLFVLHQQTTNPTLRQVVGAVARNVECGASLSESLQAYPAIFSPMYVDMIKAGEISGSLEEVLTSLSTQLGREKILRDQIRSATLYPLVILSFASLVVLFLIIFLVPMFTSVLPVGTPLPLPTRIVLGVSVSLYHYWYLYLFLSLLGLVGLGAYVQSENGKRLWDRAKFKLPIFGLLFKKATTARFSRTLALLLTTGIPLLKALDAAGSAAGSIELADAVKKTAVEIEEGRGMAAPLATSGFFPPLVVNMVAVGEETGQLPTLLGKVADFYEEEVATMTKGLTALIEPVLIIVVGCIVGGMIISIYLPLFMTVTTIGG